MDLKYFISEKKGLIIVLSVILLIAICGCLYFIFRTPKEEPVIENNESVVVEEPIEDNTEDIEEISQDSVVSVLKAYVTNIRDLSVRIEYDVKIGMGDAAVDSVVTANTNTVFYDLNKKQLISTADITVGSNIVVYGIGNYTVGNLKANVIALGEDTSYNYSEVYKIQINDDGSYLWFLNNTSDKLLVSKDCDIVDAYTGNNILNLSGIQSNSKVLYKYAPDFTITDMCNIYNCEEVIVVGYQE